MFAHLSARRNLLAAQAILVATQAVERIDYPGTGGLIASFITTSRTAGHWNGTWEGSLDGSTWFALGSDLDTGTISVNGVAYTTFNGPVPKWLRVTVTPGGGFDGAVEIYLHSSLGVSAGANAPDL